jgi:Cys-rich protein (TIGR01571 family)
MPGVVIAHAVPLAAGQPQQQQQQQQQWGGQQSLPTAQPLLQQQQQQQQQWGGMQQQHRVNIRVPQSNQIRDGLCDCGQDCSASSFWVPAFCPCVTFGRLKTHVASSSAAPAPGQQLSAAQQSQLGAVAAYTLLQVVMWSTYSFGSDRETATSVASTHLGLAKGASNAAYYAAQLGLCLLTYALRLAYWRLRRLPDDPASCVVSCFCGPCVLMQMARDAWPAGRVVPGGAGDHHYQQQQRQQQQREQQVYQQQQQQMQMQMQRQQQQQQQQQPMAMAQPAHAQVVTIAQPGAAPAYQPAASSGTQAGLVPRAF